MSEMIEVQNMPIKDAFKVAQAKKFYDDYLKVVDFLGKDVADKEYLFNEAERQKLVDAKGIRMGSGEEGMYRTEKLDWTLNSNK